jgi:hypothetical protein
MSRDEIHLEKLNENWEIDIIKFAAPLVLSASRLMCN